MNYTPQTEVHLLKDVPFNLTYNNVRDFNTLPEQTKYFIDKTKYTFDKLTYQRVSAESIKLDIAYDDMLDVNYMMFKNDSVPGKWFYAFITDYEFISQNVTRVTYQLDVFQTYLFDFSFQTTYVEREHTKRFDEDGLPVVNTLEEGLNYGSDYKVVNAYHVEQATNIVWAIIVSKVALESIPNFQYGGSVLSGVSTPLYFYGVPLNLNGTQPTVNGQSVDSISALFSLFTTNSDFVGSIVSMYYTAYIPFPVTYSGNNLNVPAGINIVNIASFKACKFNASGWGTINSTVLNNVYNDFPKYEESKLYMYPYSIIEITNQKGEVFTLKMENLDVPGGMGAKRSLTLKILSSIGVSPKTAIIPMYYLNNTNIYDYTDLSYGIIDNDVSDIPIVDDYTASYIQGNRNTINTTNKYALDNAKRGVSQNNANNRLQNAITTRQQDWNSVEGFGNMLSSAFGLNLGGIVSSGLSMTKAYDLMEAGRASMNLNNAFANQNLMINAEQQIGLTQAKLEDINNVPPTISNLGNNSLFNLGNGISGCFVVLKTIREEYVTQLTNYFKMFGYKVNKMEIPNLKSRRSYNYIKTVDANIVGDVPNNYLNTLKGIFDKGITIWHTNDIGNYSLNNEEV